MSHLEDIFENSSNDNFLYIEIFSNGTIKNLPGYDSGVQIKTKGLLFGLGYVKITVTVKADGLEEQRLSKHGLLVGSFVLMRFPRVTVSGMINDKDSKEGIGFAKVVAKNHDKNLVIKFDRTNIISNKGFYKLNLPPGCYEITASKPISGYQSKSVNVTVENGKNINLDFILKK